MCYAYLESTLQITCPAFDDEDFENGASEAEGTCNLTDNYSTSQGCVRVVRRISWKKIETDFFNFTCFCGIKLQPVENGNNQVSVKIINQGMY